MGFAHLLASFVLFLFANQSNDMIVHFWGGVVEIIIGLYVLKANNYKFTV
jgi:hypothetical protein